MFQTKSNISIQHRLMQTLATLSFIAMGAFVVHRKIMSQQQWVSVRTTPYIKWRIRTKYEPEFDCVPGVCLLICRCLINTEAIHDDVIKWKHFPRYWPFVRGIHRSPVNSPHKGQWRGALMFSLICTLINSWVNNGEAGDLRRYRAHYDVTVK